MEPAVPFAALGTTALLAVAAWGALAAAALALRGLRTPSVLLGLGCLLLAGVEVATAVRFGPDSSDRLALLRGTGGLLLTAGLALGALAARPGPDEPAPGASSSGGALLATPAPGTPAPGTPIRGTALSGVVVPLAAAPAPALLAGGSLLAAAAMAVRSRRDLPGALLGGGLVLAAAAALAAPLADDGPRAALAVVAVRGAGALLLLAGLALLAQVSLLAKVVATTVAGVLAMSTAALGVVGTVVVQSSERQASELVTETALARAGALQELAPQLLLPARSLEQVCRDRPADCRLALDVVSPDRAAFAVRVPREGAVGTVVQRGEFSLAEAERQALQQQPAVQRLLSGRARQVQAELVRLSGSGRLAAVGVAPGPRESPDLPLSSVLVFGVPLTDEVLAAGLTEDDFGVALLAGTPLRVTASEGDAARDAGALARTRRLLDEEGSLGRGRTLLAVGTSPTLRVQPLRDTEERLLGYLAVTRDAVQALASQRAALSSLLLAAVATTALVAVLAVLLGRRTVDPVRRLTAAAQRLAAGDLRASGAGVRSRDEVGVLSRTFDTMTGSLARLTGDLRSSAARLETVLASMSDGLLSTDADGRVTAVNRAALEMLALPETAVVGQPLEAVADVRGTDGAPLADAGLRVQDAPAEVHRADGSTVPVRVSVSGLRGSGGGPDLDGAVVVLRDTTREVEVERMKTEFLSNVSHELRTPLTPIRGYAEILVNRPGLDGDKVGRFAGTILSEALKMNRVVDLLVDVASLEAGRVVPRPVEVDVRDLLDARLDAWRVRTPDRTEDLRRRVAGGLPTVVVDPEWCGKALDELIDNALKFSQPGTPVTLAASRAPDGDRVRVAVRDAGPGIAQADQALLFTSFEQVDGSATRRVGGLGLGLSFVRRVADDAGFPLTVYSEVGRGSEFALDLPAGAPPQRRRPAKGVSPGSRAARR